MSGNTPDGPTIPVDMSAGQRRWETRRAKYGPSGHAGSYTRFPRAERGALRLVIDLHREAVLSEGQVAAATGLDRVMIREMVDGAGGYIEQPAVAAFNEPSE